MENGKKIQMNPEAYYYMALIAAEMKYYFFATLNMRKCLLLMSDAEYARKAQDKIYEWEIILNPINSLANSKTS